MKKARGTKRALAMSVLAMVLCIAMLIGTTFAWFTDSVTSANNRIVAGNLDVELYYQNDETTEWTKVTSETNIFKDSKETLWEPGHTEVIKLKIANEGSLALKYQLGVNIASEIGSINVEGDPFKLSDYIYFGVAEGEQTYKDRDSAVASVAKDAFKIKEGYTKASSLEADEDAYLTMVVYMPTTVGNEANYAANAAIPVINLGLNLYATQMNYENDSFGNDYDKNASIVVEPGESISDAVKQIENGGIVFLENGVHTVDSVVTISGKNISIIGLGEVTLQYKATGGSHFFNVADSSNVTFENLTMLNAAKHGVYVRNNAVVTMKDVVIKGSRGSADIMIDEASDAAHGKETASYVWLYNSDIGRVAMCASPVTSVAATQDTFVYFNYDADSSVGSLEVQNINLKPENIFINGVASTEVGKTMQLYVTNDAELAAALETIKTDSNYWNKNVNVYMAAGVYSADHVINQYPKWNGIVGRNNGNNYQGGVTAGDPCTLITFIGEKASTYSLRGAQAVPAVMFTGNVTVNGFGDAQTGFATAVARTAFENIAFANGTKPNADGNIAAVEMTAAAAHVAFNQCTFQNAKYIIVGARAYNIVDDITFDGCTFSDVCISGYVDKILTVKNSVVLNADNGFLNNQNSGDIVVENCTINAGKYFVRTNGTGIKVTVTNSDITVYESEGTKHLVYFRGSNESADFIDCTITSGYTVSGVDADSTLSIIDFYEKEGISYYSDELSGAQILYLVPADYADDTVNVAEGTTAIENFAFAYNSTVKTVVLASTVRDLGRGFDGSAVEKVVLNEGLTVIGSRAFRSTTALKEVVISTTVTEIADNAFQKSAIKEIVIPANVKTIGETAFGASKIEKVTFEGNISIQGYAFRGCPNLRTVYMNGHDVSFVPSTLNGRNSMWFCNGESNNANTSNITFYVKNDVIKERVLTAMGAERANTTVYCEAQTADEKGLYTDTSGNKYTYANNNVVFNTAIENGADVIYLSSGNFIVPDSAQGKTLTFVGNGDTKIATQDDGSYEGCDYSLDGATVTFEGVVINTDSRTYTGYARCKGTYNNCTINGAYTLYGESVFNNCTFNVTGDTYNIWTWGAKTVEFNNCTFNTDGKSILVYNQSCDVYVNDCVFNDRTNGTGFTKSALETGVDGVGPKYNIYINNTEFNGFAENDKCVGYKNIVGNKNSLTDAYLNIVVDGVDVY